MTARDLVTGAAGLIGHEVARQLVESGREVVALDSGVKGPIADLDDQGPARAALRQLSDADSWRRHFVEAVVDRLKIAYESVKQQVAA